MNQNGSPSRRSLKLGHAGFRLRRQLALVTGERLVGGGIRLPWFLQMLYVFPDLFGAPRGRRDVLLFLPSRSVRMFQVLLLRFGAVRAGQFPARCVASFRSSIPSPPVPLFTLRRTPRGAQRKTRGRAVRYSFLVGLFHSLLHAGLSRRTALAIKRQPRILRTPVCAAMSVSQTITHQRIESRFGTASAVLPGRFWQETIDA
jgi:hypothetical protein